jgi:hypothetical protein
VFVKESVSRRAAQTRRRRERRWKTVKLVAMAIVGIMAGTGIFLGLYAVVALRNGGDDPSSTSQTPAGAEQDPVVSTLLFGTREKAQSGDVAVWLSLLSYDRINSQGSIIYIPAHTATEVPGRGLMGAGEALSSGGIPLLLVSAENLLGVEIDRYVELSDSDARVLFEETGPVSVDVPAEVSVKVGANRARLLFGEGPQQLSSRFLEQLLYVSGIDGDEAELGSRHLAFWKGLFERFQGDAGALSGAVERSDAALGESDTPIAELASFFEDLAELAPGQRVLATLPVQQVTVGEDELYEVDGDRLVDFMTETIGSNPTPSDEIRVQILNGNGVPGIGEKVAQRLRGEGFRVILSGNARRLDYTKTLLVTYDSSNEAEAAARRARELVGVGEVQIAAQGQGIVDLTIVVGRDFLRAN